MTNDNIIKDTLRKNYDNVLFIDFVRKKRIDKEKFIEYRFKYLKTLESLIKTLEDKK